jgi:hypothetical protein
MSLMDGAENRMPFINQHSRIALTDGIRLGVLAAVGYAGAASAQNFQNLDFESPDLSGYSAGASIPLSIGLPGWDAYYGSGINRTIVTNIFYGGHPGPGGAPQGLTLLSTNLHQTTLQGALSLMLVSPFAASPATIFQTGMVPTSATSLRFRVEGSFTNINFTVSFGGQTLAVHPLANRDGYILYGVDVSSFAGQTAELDFTAVPSLDLGGRTVLDGIEFSAVAIPEPAIHCFLGLALAVGCFHLAARRLA